MSAARKSPDVLPGPQVAAGPAVRGTRYPEIFRALAEPFAPTEVKQREGGGRGKMLSYITARIAMNRLDEVLGPENWWEEFFEVCGVLFCRITVRLPDGSTVAKCDAGGFKEMMEKGKLDKENTDKTGSSDAFKRAAAKFGIARYLYRDGVADFSAPEAPPAHGNGSAHGRGQYASPAQADSYRAAVKGWIEKRNREWVESWESIPGVEQHLAKVPELLSTFQVNGHIVKWAVNEGRLDASILPEELRARQQDNYPAVVWHASGDDRRAVKLELIAYADRTAREKAEAIYRKHPGLRPDGDEGDGGVVPDEFVDPPFDPETSGRSPGEEG